MRLATPLGLLGLLGILFLVLIYILKPKYQEKSISSTFIWKLSLKYKKQKMPFQWLKSSLLVILQFIILALLAFALTSPQLVLDTKSGEKIIILDASANMQMMSDGRTRFDRAIQEIGALADSTTPEHRFTVILAGQEASFVARRLDSSTYIKQLLSELEVTFEDADMDAAISLTEGVLAENPEAEIMLFTGNNYSETGSIQVRDMSNKEWNVSILDFSADLHQGYYEFSANVASYNKDTDIAVSLYVDDEYRDIKTVSASDNAEYNIVFEDLFILDYGKAEVIVEYEDDFIYDNQYTVYGWENEMFSVQLVSETPRFIQSALLTMGNFTIDVPVRPDETSEIPIQYEGYDLYIFDGVEPEYMPTDGSVWLVNPTVIPGETTLTLGTTLTGEYTLSSQSDLEPKEDAILDYVVPSNISLTSYTYVSNYTEYDCILMNNDDPVVLTKDMDGQKLVLFTFSLHNSNLPIIPEYILLMYNLANYSVQNMVEQYLFYPGDSIDVRKKPSALAVTLENPEEDLLFDAFPISMVAEDPGEYTITQTLVTGEQETVNFFVRLDEKQINSEYDYGVLSDPIIPVTSSDTNANLDTIDIISYLTGAMILLLLIEWGLHYNEHN